MKTALLYLPLMIAFQLSAYTLSMAPFEITTHLYLFLGAALFFLAKNMSETACNLDKIKLINPKLYQTVSNFGEKAFKRLSVVLCLLLFVYAELMLVLANSVAAMGYLLLAVFAWGMPRRFYLKRLLGQNPLLKWLLSSIYCFFLVWFAVGVLRHSRGLSDDAWEYAWMLYGACLAFTATLGVDPNTHPIVGSLTQRFGAWSVLKLMAAPLLIVVIASFWTAKGVEGAFLALLFSLFWGLYYAKPELYKWLEIAAYLYLFAITLLPASQVS